MAPSEEERSSMECGICYAHKQNGLLPDKACECGRMYHTTCLLEWIQSLPNTKRSFDTLFGKCLYCTQPITVKTTTSTTTL